MPIGTIVRRDHGSLRSTMPNWGNRELQNYTDSPRNVATRDGTVHFGGP